MSIYMILPKDLSCDDVLKKPSLHQFYIGSCEDFIKRMQRHKTNCYNKNSSHYTAKVYKVIRANGGFENWKMVEIGCVWGKATKTLFQIEQDYMDIYKPTLNSQRAYLTEEQKIEQRKKCDREYHIKNREKHKIYQKEYRDKNKEVLKEKNKEYSDKNRDIIRKRTKEYRDKNKEVLKEKNKEKINCECGSTFRRDKKARHLRSNKHKSFVENKE